MTRCTIAAFACLLLQSSVGCAHYEYDLVAPPELARHVGGDRDEVIRADPLEYRLRSYENRLVMDVFNPTGEPITLLGDRSSVVDPRGQSHPLRTQSIAPSAFIKLIFPPMRPVYQANPSIGIGLGVGFSRAHYHRFGYAGVYDPLWDEPQYYTYYDETDATYWDWQGETDVRMHLVYQRGQNTFSQDFTFHRKKV
jgi:hypothetical protein